MTPPDAMSWDEAVSLVNDAVVSLRNFDQRGTAHDLQLALAAIQSHRVQAEARVAELEAVADTSLALRAAIEGRTVAAKALAVEIARYAKGRGLDYPHYPDIDQTPYSEIEILDDAVEAALFALKEKRKVVTAARGKWRSATNAYRSGKANSETLRALLGAADGVRLTESDVVALVAGPYMYHHKMNDLQTRYAEGFDRCREMTIDSIKTRFAIEATLTKAPAND